MAFREIRNSADSVVLHAAANSTAVIAGGFGVSDIVLENDDPIIGATILQIMCGSPSGTEAWWEIKRGANTLAVVDSTAYLDFRAGMILNLDNDADLTVELNGSTSGYIMLEVNKLY